MSPSTNVQYLQETGPSRITDLPNHYITPSDRRNGVWKFKLTGLNHGSSDPTGGTIYGVAYLADQHSKHEVLRTFLDANPRFVAAKQPKGAAQMLRGHGRQWADAVDDIMDEYEWGTGREDEQ